MHSFPPWIWQKLTKTCGVGCRDPHACEEEHLLLMRQHRKREISWLVGGCVENEWKCCCAPWMQRKGGWITALSPGFTNGSWQQPIYARSPKERKKIKSQNIYWALLMQRWVESWGKITRSQIKTVFTRKRKEQNTTQNALKRILPLDVTQSSTVITEKRMKTNCYVW